MCGNRSGLIVIPAALLFQFGVQFEPVKTGALLEWFPTIFALSALNGFAEELPSPPSVVKCYSSIDIALNLNKLTITETELQLIAEIGLFLIGY